MYRILGRIFHPDKLNSPKEISKTTAKNQFQHISNAYELLQTEVKTKN